MSRHTDLHPTYLAAPPEERWRGGTLASLWAHLEAKAAGTPDVWARAFLPGGAIVALRQPEEGPRQLSIGRMEPFTTDEGAEKWEREVDTFAKHFGVEGWTRSTAQSRRGGPLTMFVERPAMDLFAAAAARDEGIERVERHADPAWLARALAAVRGLCETRETFIVDAVWETGLARPKGDARAIGAVMLRASREGLCEPTDQFETGTQEKSHGNPRRVWRSLTFTQRRRA